MSTMHLPKPLAACAALGLVVGSVAMSPSAQADPYYSTHTPTSTGTAYHDFTVPLSLVPGGKCDVSATGGLELYGNIGPSGTWAASAMGASGDNCATSLGPLDPGLYYYEYVATLEDRTKQAFSLTPDDPDPEVLSHPTWNTLFVPGDSVDWMADVSGGGEVVSPYYPGPSLRTQTWTPPGYDADRATPYPVLYLLPKSEETWRDWQDLGRLPQILDNLYAAGALADMVVVMLGSETSDDTDLLMSFSQRDFNISTEAAGQAIAGIGDGANQALTKAIADPTAFSAIGSLSGYLGDVAIDAATATALNDTADLIRFYSGNALDPHYNDTFDATQALAAAGVEYQSDGVTPGSGGVWETWRLNLRDFAARLFQETPVDPAMSEGNYALDKAYVAPAVGSITTPVIDEHGIVTFETGTQWADAKDVVLWADWAPNGAWFRIPLTKVGDRWRGSIGPLDGFYYWRYEVDAVNYPDPEDKTPGKVNMESQLWVDPGDRTPLLAPAPENQTGTVDVIEYDSPTFDIAQHLKVWTPVDYDPERTVPYPVVYLYHGFGQNYASWTEQGRAAQILDNLYAAGDLTPMVVVMAEYPSIFGAGSIFADDLFTSIIPLVESRYNVSDQPGMRALAGLSMGGMGTTQVMTGEASDQFAYYGIFSGAFGGGTFSDELLTSMKESTKLVEYFVGDADYIAGVVEAGQEQAKLLNDAGVDALSLVVPGPHGFDVWWQGWSDFAPRLFKDSVAVSSTASTDDLGTAEVGYTTVDPAVITISNAGVTTSSNGTIALSGPNADAFVLSASEIGVLKGGQSIDVNVTPVTGLAVGVYQATVTVTVGDAVSTHDLRFEVKAAPVKPPTNSGSTPEPTTPTKPAEPTKPGPKADTGGLAVDRSPSPLALGLLGLGLVAGVGLLVSRRVTDR